MSDQNAIIRYAIHPGIGIARVGNSPDEYFTGPEAPGEVPNPEGGYKDSAGRIKRQAARFRIYGFNEAGDAVREITADDAEITWRVHVANRKAGWYQFLNAMDLGKFAMTAALRNKSITGADRQKLIVDDLERSIAYYQKIGFTFGEPWEGFYAIGVLDGLELHLKEAPKNDADRQHRRDNDHLDASAGVDGVEAFYEQCIANGVTIIKPITATEWGTKGFYVEDPDGYIIGFGGRPAAG